LRQGNENKHVRIFRYITDRTFDAYSYQLLENKQKFISQLMSGDIKVKTCEDIDEKTLEYAEVKALIAGNPLIKVKIDLETEINTLRILKASHDRQKYNIQDRVMKHLPERIAAAEIAIANISSDIINLNKQKPVFDEDGKEHFPVTVSGIEYLKREDAGQAIRTAMINADVMQGKDTVIGEYKGFTLSVFLDKFSETFKAHLKGRSHYYCELNSNSALASGNITRLDNLIKNIPAQYESKVQELESLKKDLAIAEKAATEEFPRMQEFLDKEAELLKVDIQLRESEKYSPENHHIFEQLGEMFPTVMAGEERYIRLSAQGNRLTHFLWSALPTTSSLLRIHIYKTAI